MLEGFSVSIFKSFGKLKFHAIEIKSQNTNYITIVICKFPFLNSVFWRLKNRDFKLLKCKNEVIKARDCYRNKAKGRVLAPIFLKHTDLSDESEIIFH